MLRLRAARYGALLLLPRHAAAAGAMVDAR